MEKVIYINLCFRLMIMKRNGVSFTLHCCCHRHRRCTSMIHNTRKYWNERTNETRAQDVPFWECEFFWWMKRNEIKFESHNKLEEKYKKNCADEQWSSFSSRFEIYDFMLEMPSEAAISQERLKHSTSLDSIMRHFSSFSTVHRHCDHELPINDVDEKCFENSHPLAEFINVSLIRWIRRMILEWAVNSYQIPSISLRRNRINIAEQRLPLNKWARMRFN